MLSEALKCGFKESEEFIAELKERLEDNMVFRLFFPPSRRKSRTSVKNNNIKNGRI
jgi:ribosomal protein S4